MNCLSNLCSQSLFAQSFSEGTTTISLGYGFGNLNKALFNTYSGNSGYKASGFGPIFGKFEYGVSDRIGLGVNVAHIGINASYTESGGSSQSYNYKIDWKNTSVLGRLNIHFSRSEKLDAFWGFGMGYRFGGWKFTDNDPDTNTDTNIPNVIPFGFETTVGIRYYFVEHIGVYAEAGLAKAPIQFGLSAKF